MDVFHVGASAPKAPESKSVDRDSSLSSSARSKPVDAERDAFASSPDAAAVERHVRSLAALTDTRDDVITGMSELLGDGMLDTPDAAREAAQGILDS